MKKTKSRIDGEQTQEKNMAVPETNVKQFLHTLADRLPDGASLDEALYHITLRREIELGLADSEGGRTRSIEDILAHRGIVE